MSVLPGRGTPDSDRADGSPRLAIEVAGLVLYPDGLLLALRSMSVADAHGLIAKIPTSAFPGTRS